MGNHTQDELLELLREKASEYGRCCDQWQDSLGGFHCRSCGQETFAMLANVQVLLGVNTKAYAMTHEESRKKAVLRMASPDMLKVLKGCADALKEAGKDFALSSPNAARPNLFELHEQQARAVIAKATAE